jgi:multidrug efflux pump
MQQLAEEELAPGLGYEWSELAFFELQAGTTKLDLFGWPLVMDTGMLLFTLAVIMVFLVLAAQYESWSLPMVVILVVPMCLLSAVVGVTAIPAALTGLGDVLKGVSETLAYRIGGGNAPNDINIFTQIGFVVLVGLASKNAILLVEFAKRQRDGGASAREAALAACKLRLRPIVMTSCAFILGVSPLLIAHGAGAEMRRTLGTAVFSGMLGVTLFGLFLTPVFFTVVDRISRTRFFTSRAMRVLGTALLMVLTLGLVWLVRRMWEEYNARRARAQGRGKE